mgnify:CR=1 FL=1|tara:strand:+ start:929 stop:1120 length:192 start_codon:yes stop_codon:yes gene_type:complete
MKDFPILALSYEEVAERYNFLQEQVILFRNLVSEIDISKYDQTEYISVVNSIYYEIFISQEEE